MNIDVGALLLTGLSTKVKRFYGKNETGNLLSTYFEEHDVITTCNVHITWVFASLHIISHCVIDLLEIVGAENNTHRSTE